MVGVKSPMRAYRADDLPVTCADCGGRLRWIAERYAWTHVTRGADHAPRITGTVAS